MFPRRLPRIVAVLGVLVLALSLSGFVPGAVPRGAAEPEPAAPLTVRLDSVTPDVVTTSSDATVTVTGTVTNIGDRPVRDVLARLEQGPAVTSSSALRTNLAVGGEFEPVGDFIRVASDLDRGQAAGFEFSVPIGTGPQPSLRIDTPGVYPVLVNVNGTPADGVVASPRRGPLPAAGDRCSGRAGRRGR